jgi:hypothetical protein
MGFPLLMHDLWGLRRLSFFATLSRIVMGILLVKGKFMGIYWDVVLFWDFFKNKFKKIKNKWAFMGNIGHI